MSSSLTDLTTYFLQPTIVAAAASLGIHGLLGLSLPAISAASKQAEQNQKGNVKVVELTPEELSRVPSLSSTPNTSSYVPYGQPSQSLPPSSLYSPPPSTFPFPANPSDSDLIGGTLPRTPRYKLPRPSVREKTSNKTNTRIAKRQPTSNGYGTEGVKIAGSGLGSATPKPERGDRTNVTSGLGSEQKPNNSDRTQPQDLPVGVSPGNNKEIDNLIDRAGQPSSQNSQDNSSGKIPNPGSNPNGKIATSTCNPDGRVPCSPPSDNLRDTSKSSNVNRNYQSLLADSQITNGEQVKPPIDKSIDYPQGRSCLPDKSPKLASFMVIVDPNGNGRDNLKLIGGTGYNELDLKALEKVRESVQEAIDKYRKEDKGKPQAYQFRVTVNCK